MLKLRSKPVIDAKIGYDPDGYPDIYIKYGFCPDCGRMVDENNYQKCPRCGRRLNWYRTIVKENY